MQMKTNLPEISALRKEIKVSLCYKCLLNRIHKYFHRKQLKQWNRIIPANWGVC